jgi:hypothetical protein
VPGETVFDLRCPIAYDSMAEHLPGVHFLIFGPPLTFFDPGAVFDLP